MIDESLLAAGELPGIPRFPDAVQRAAVHR
jgi:hypothetical protein